jgi:abnormal spindle-like microcephaly-associated protein
VRLQARWRGRRLRRDFLRVRAAATRLQAVVRGWQARRWVLNYITIPAILQRCLEAKQALQLERLDAYVGRFATRAQAIRRGCYQRRQFLRQRTAAVLLQAAWRCATARRAFLAMREAAAVVQRRWRLFIARRQAMQLQVRIFLQPAKPVQVYMLLSQLFQCFGLLAYGGGSFQQFSRL